MPTHEDEDVQSSVSKFNPLAEAFCVNSHQSDDVSDLHKQHLQHTIQSLIYL